MPDLRTNSLIPDFPQFRLLELSDFTFLSQLYLKFPPQTCELNLANLFIWQEADQPQISQLFGNILIKIDSVIEPAFLLDPIGDQRLLETVETIQAQKLSLNRISENFIAKLPDNVFTCTELIDQFDYIYLRNDLAELKGRKYDGKRNHINKFNRLYPNHAYVPLIASHINEALAVFDRWFHAQADQNEQDYLLQKNALIKAFSLFDTLNLFGGSIYVNNQMQGFMLASKATQDTLDLHFWYGDFKTEGIFPMLIQQTCGQTFTDYTYINFEQDMGLPGLRQGKQSYKPVKLMKKFLLSNEPIL